MARARLYGQAVQVLDECLGESVRITVMERFSAMAGPSQRRGLKEPWEMIAQAALAAGVSKSAVQALRIVYLMRTERPDMLVAGSVDLSESAFEYLRRWGVLGEFEARRKGR